MAGGEQLHYLWFEGNKLFIESPVTPNTNGTHSMVRAIVAWQRE